MPNPLNGISDIELLPTFNFRQVVGRLQSSLRDAESLRAAVAYWCVGINQVGSALVEAIMWSGLSLR